MNNKEEAIREIVYNDDNIVKLIKEAPQTYNSILQEFKDNGTMQCVLRRRISRLLKQNQLWKMRVPGTRFGLMLFCTPEHDYTMIAHDTIIGKTRLFYALDYKSTDNMIILENYWELKGPNWSKWKYENDILKIPIHGNRSDTVTIWE